MIIGTAGHVDHGKTALVRALTGVDADRLPEEKRRGITIDLGYAYSGDLGFIDVPGHERLVHTMLAGASGIDAALLVVAADDGVMPQTREHLQILDLLGVHRGVVAVSKADLAPERVAAVAAETRRLLRGTGLAEAALFPVSSVTGEGVDALRAALLAFAPRPRPIDAHPRLAVDRAFTLVGAGLVVTGTLVAGTIAAGDRLLLSPQALEVRVRGLHAQNRPAGKAVAGQRVALNITGSRLSKEIVRRGDWVLHPDAHAPTASLDVRLRMLPDEARALGPGASVHLHLGSAHVLARVTALDAALAEPGSSTLARLALDRPIGALWGDRLVLRDPSATRTIGGGWVIDPFPPKRGGRIPARLAQLAALERTDPADALCGVLAAEPGWIAAASFFLARNLPPGGQPGVLEAAPAVPLGGLLIAPERLDLTRHAAVQGLAAEHADAPDEPGLPPERLRLRLPSRPPPPLFRGLVETMLASGLIEQDGPWLRLPSHRATLNPEQERIWRDVRRLIAAERFRPPRTRDLAQALGVREPTMRGMLKRLQRMGKLVEIAHDHFFLRETLAEMAGIADSVGAEEGVLTAAAFRDRLGNGRKVAIQILEFFDRAGLTLRSGDARRVRPDRVGIFGMPEEAAGPPSRSS